MIKQLIENLLIQNGSNLVCYFYLQFITPSYFASFIFEFIFPMKSKKESIKTYVRIRPLDNNDQKLIFKKNVCTVVATKSNDDYSFDSVFDQATTNEDVYNTTAKELIEQGFQGYNCCVMAYGQTNSGKTHTMKGTPQNPGIVPLSLRDIFKKKENESDKITIQIKVSYIQIYNQIIIDLLSDNTNSPVQTGSTKDPHKKNQKLLHGCTQSIVYNLAQAMELLYFFIQNSNKGQQRRKFKSNNVNEMSSRSHVIFKITLDFIKENEISSTRSQINLVDLAGSEGSGKTGSQKDLKVEGENINKSLLALVKVIKSFSSKQAYVNVRDSKLTRILQKSLLSNTKSCIICMINPSSRSYQQSVNTLKFGLMAGKINIEARKNMIQQEQNNKSNIQMMNRQLEFFPSQRQQLIELRAANQRYEDEIKKYDIRLNQLEEDNIKKDNQNRRLQAKQSELKNVIDKLLKTNSQSEDKWMKMEQALNYKVTNYKAEMQDLYKLNNQLKTEKKILEKNQRSLVERLQQSEIISSTLNRQIQNMKNRLIEQQNSKSKRTSFEKDSRPMINQPMQMVQKARQNPFNFGPPPYNPDGQRHCSFKVAKVLQLKLHVIELARMQEEYINANAEIRDRNEQLQMEIQSLRQRINQLQREGIEISSTSKVSSKINPAHIEYNEMRKLNNKIKQLKEDLNSSLARERKCRNFIKHGSKNNLQQIEEFQEWFNRKNDKMFFLQKQTQTQQQKIRSSPQKGIQQVPEQRQSVLSENLILNRTSQIKSQNPEDLQIFNGFHSEQRHKVNFPNENDPSTTNQINFFQQNRQSINTKNESLLLDDLIPSHSKSSKRIFSIESMNKLKLRSSKKDFNHQTLSNNKNLINEHLMQIQKEQERVHDNGGSNEMEI